MKFETTRDGALKKLDNFIENEVVNYNSKRNFDNYYAKTPKIYTNI